MKRFDLYIVAGGACCVLFSYVDTQWRYFWIAAGICMIGWTLIAAFCSSGKS